MPPIRFAVLLAALFPLAVAWAGDDAELGAPPAFPSRAVVPPPEVAVPQPRPDRAAVVERYHTLFVPAAAVAIGWAGDVATCNAGSTTPAFKQAVLDRLNFYRFVAALPPLALYPGAEAVDVQNAALYVDANSTTAIPSAGTNFCDSASSSSGRMNSLLALGAYGTAAVDRYIDDAGAANGAAGHRRMLLFPPLTNVATGDVPPTPASGNVGANALWVAGPYGQRPFTPYGTAWPPAGFVPWNVMPKASNRWSFSYPGAVWVAPSVSVTRFLSFGIALEPTDYSFGDSTLVFTPQNFQYTAPDTDVPYSVSVSGFLVNGAPYNATYDVTSIDADQLSASLAGDFDGDGKSDIVWHEARTGTTYLWLMNGLAFKAGSATIRTSADWRPAFVGDFDGDGKSDIVWRNDTTGATEIWLMNGATIKGSAEVIPAGTVRVTHVADLDGDGKSDLVLYEDRTAAWLVWTMNGLTPVAKGAFICCSEVVKVGDFDGDGKADLLVKIPNFAPSVTYSVLLMDGISIRQQGFPVLSSNEWVPTHVGDFDGDGKTDLVWRRVTTGETNLWLMNGLNFSSGRNVLNNIDWRVVAVGDFDGDGKSDLIWRNRQTGETAMWVMNGLALSTGGSLIASRDWQPAIIGNFDGDAGSARGRQDILWRNTATGQHSIWLMNGYVPHTGGGVLTGITFWPAH